MTKRTHTKRAWISSMLALLLCVSMLLGTTFAWFTDTASTAVNRIQAGTLDVALEKWNGTAWVDAEGEPLNFKTADNRTSDILWEPGCSYELPKLRVVNKGNLALKYQTIITGIRGDAKLNEVIDWTVSGAEDGFLLAQDSKELTICGTMRSDAGNEYQGLSIEGIAITVTATQYTYENDSNGNTYDSGANAISVWDGSIDAAGLAANTDTVNKTVSIKTAAQLAAFAASVNANPTGVGNQYVGYTVNLMSAIDLNGLTWTPIGNVMSARDFPDHAFQGSFNGNGFTICNLKTNATGYFATAGLFGTIGHQAVVRNVCIDGASVTSEHYAGAVVAYIPESAAISGCLVKNSSVITKVAYYTVAETDGWESTDGYNNGDKAGAIAGHIVDSVISDCRVENTSVVGYRDIGGVVGAMLQGSTVKECKLSMVRILQNTDNGYKSTVPITLGEIAGRNLDSTLADNQVTDTTVTGAANVSLVGGGQNATSAMASANAHVFVEAPDNSLTFGGNATVGDGSTVDLGGTTQKIHSAIKAENGQDIAMANGTLVGNSGLDKIRMDSVVGKEQKAQFANMTLTNEYAALGYGLSDTLTSPMVQIVPKADGENVYVFKNTVFNNASVTIAGLSGSMGRVNVVFENCVFNNIGHDNAIDINGNYCTGEVTLKNCTFNLSTTATARAVSYWGSQNFAIHFDGVTVNGTAADAAQYRVASTLQVEAYKTSGSGTCTVTGTDTVTVQGIATK